MDEYISQEQHRTEVAALNHEIIRLTKKLEQNEKERIQSAIPDKQDPFGNPTEYHEYNDDYTKIFPQLEAPGCRIPLEPGYEERRRLKRFYKIGGWSIVIHFLASQLIATGIAALISLLLSGRNPDADADAIYTYMKSSSILAAITMIVYLITNVGCALIGLKLSKTSLSSLTRTRNFSFGTAVQYCLSALFIWVISGFISVGINDIFEKYGYTTDVMDTEGMAVTGTGIAIMAIYNCIVAPITEELFFRGMLLKIFSRANQRFGVFATAVFFGLAHGNIPQFLLAFSLGILLAHITLRHCSIIPSIIVHMFVNTVVMVIGLLEPEGSTMIIVTLIIQVAAAVGMLLLISFCTHNRLPSTTPAQSRRGLSVASNSLLISLIFWIQLANLIFLIIFNMNIFTLVTNLIDKFMNS